MDDGKAEYELSQQESGWVTRLCILDAFVVLSMAVAAAMVIRGMSGSMTIPGVSFPVRPAGAFWVLHIFHFALGFVALPMGQTATRRMDSLWDSKFTDIFRGSGAILTNKHEALGWCRVLTWLCPWMLTMTLTDKSVAHCLITLFAGFPWMVLWANTQDFRYKESGPVTIWTYLKIPLQIVYHFCWAFLQIVRMLLGVKRPQ